MQEVFEKIMEEIKEKSYEIQLDGAIVAATKKVAEVPDIVNIVNTISEQYNNGWIPCSEDNKNFPADCERVRVTLWCGDEFTGYRKDGKWFIHGGNGIAEADVIAWQPTQPYQPKGE